VHEISLIDSTYDGNSPATFKLNINVDKYQIVSFNGFYNDTPISFTGSTPLKDISCQIRTKTSSDWGYAGIQNLNTIHQNIIKSVFVIYDWLELFICHPQTIDGVDMLQDEFILNKRDDVENQTYIYFLKLNKYQPTDLDKLLNIGIICKTQLLLDTKLLIENYHTALALQTVRVDSDLGKIKSKIMLDCANRMERWQNGTR
jgi:hypothetical protein